MSEAGKVKSKGENEADSKPDSFRPPDITMSPPAPDDLRVGHLIGRDLAGGQAPRVVIIGFPTDEGVRRNGGRVGAAAAPAEIRRLLYRLTPDAQAPDRFVDLLAQTRDLGDLVVSADLEADQERLGVAVAEALAVGAFPIVIGGGHETAYGHFLGYVRAGRAVTLLNWDAHPDVRPLVDGRGHSGSPFRQALLHPSGLGRRYLVAGLLPQSVSSAHLDFLAEHRGRAIFRQKLTLVRVRGIYVPLRAPVLASFDIDAVDQSQAPGVSAPAAGGLSANLWLEAAYQAGRSAAVTSFDIVETNPTFDRDHQTARLAAVTIFSLLRGIAERRVGRKALAERAAGHARRRRATSRPGSRS